MFNLNKLTNYVDLKIYFATSSFPVSGLSFPELVTVSYEVTTAMVNATALKAYVMYLKHLVLSILEKADRSMKLSSVSTGIIPAAKNPARTRAICIPRVAEATADRVIAEI